MKLALVFFTGLLALTMNIVHKENRAKTNKRIVKKTGRKEAVPTFTESAELSAYSGKILFPKKHEAAKAFFQNIRSAD